MNDHELLELAAKANGFQVKGWVGGRLVFFNPITESAEEIWNPLSDDGDALRLAVALDLTIYRCGSMPGAKVRTTDADTTYSDACVRRAIVTAAAAIGKSLS